MLQNFWLKTDKNYTIGVVYVAELLIESRKNYTIGVVYVAKLLNENRQKPVKGPDMVRGLSAGKQDYIVSINQNYTNREPKSVFTISICIL